MANDRSGSKPELSEEELEEARKELAASTAALPVDPAHVFTAALSEWEQWESERIAQMTAYEHIRELIGQDRNAVVRQYTMAKHNLAIWERAVLDAFHALPVDQQEAALQEGAQIVLERPGLLKTYRLSSTLKKKLRGVAVDGAAS